MPVTAVENTNPANLWGSELPRADLATCQKGCFILNGGLGSLTVCLLWPLLLCDIPL